MFINYAHRGASSYAPENTYAAFYKAIEMNANGIETDVQKTKDGVLVLHHDDSLFRIAGIEKSVSDLTLRELNALDFGIFFGEKYVGERVVTLESFLFHFSGKPLHFAIEIKQGNIEDETLSLCDKYLPRSQFTITSFLLDSILKLSATKIPPELGYLSTSFDVNIIEQIRASGIGEYCPFAPSITVDEMFYLRKRGFSSIRAWGVSDEKVMRHALNMGVDGMTVNFPDKLCSALEGKYT